MASNNWLGTAHRDVGRKLGQLVLVILTLAFVGQVSATSYSVTATRVGSNFYSLTNGNLVNTRFCYEYAYSAASTLTITANSGYSIGSIKFQGGGSCDVAFVYGISYQSPGSYAVTLSFEDFGYYRDMMDFIIATSFTCMTMVYYNNATLRMSTGTTGTVTFSGGNSCSVIGVYSPIRNLSLAPSVDLQAPSVPLGLTATASSASQIALNWAASTDNTGVTSYKVYRSGIQVGTPSGTSYNDTGLAAGASYSYTVAACDAVGNCSQQSTAVIARTNSSTTPNLISDCLFTWAETAYPTLFSPAGAVSTTLTPYYYRYYSRTGAYLGTSASDSHVYYLGQLSSNALLDLGLISTWQKASGCQ